MSQTPLLQGADAALAWEAIEAIAADLKKPPEPPEQRLAPWEQALFFGYLAQAAQDAEARQVCAELLDQSRELLPQTGWLHGGLTGVGWVICNLQRMGIAAGHEDLLEAIDEAVLADLEIPPTEGFDLISGLAGTGIYALERWPCASAIPMLERVVRQLGVLSEAREGEVCWRTPPELIPATKPRPAGGYLDVGVAHGGPGALVVLEGAALRGIERAQAVALRDGHLRWLERQMLPEHESLPAFIGEGIEGAPTRLAWCYGDAGVAGVVEAVARVSGVGRGLADRLTAATLRRPPDRGGVVDAPLCHGAAGLGHVLHRLSWQGAEDRRGAARFWLCDTLRRRGAAGYGGFWSWSPLKGIREASRGLLDGSSGVGLALLAAVTSQEPAWDRMLGLSIRQD